MPDSEAAARGEEGSQIFIAVTVILIALTPLLFSIAKKLQHRFEGGSDAVPEEVAT